MKKLSPKLFFLCILLFSLSGCVFWWWTDSVSHAKQAAQLRADHKFDEAVAEYRKHIEVRLRDSHREPDENPYFYEILIGDTLFDKEDVKGALESYLSAKSHEVEAELVGDRIRKVAKFYREQGDYKPALELLHQYRPLDDFGFDSDIDETAKLLMRSQEPQPETGVTGKKAKKVEAQLPGR